MPRPTLKTPLTELLGIDTPVLLAGMNGVSHSELAAAVTNGGGLGVIGGLTMQVLGMLLLRTAIEGTIT